jgi:hypothetical protein
MATEKEATEAADKAFPILKAAMDAIDCIGLKDIQDITALPNPPTAIKFMSKLLLLLFKQKFSKKDDDKKIFVKCRD